MGSADSFFFFCFAGHEQTAMKTSCLKNEILISDVANRKSKKIFQRRVEDVLGPQEVVAGAKGDAGP